MSTEKIAQSKSDSLNRVIGVLALIGVFGGPLSVSRYAVTGWIPIYSVHILLMSAIITLWLSRHKLSMPVRFWGTTAIMWAIGVSGVFTYGMMAAGVWWLATSALLGGMVMSQRTGFLLMAISVVVMILAASGFVSGSLTLNFDLEAYVSSVEAWSIYLLAAALLPLMVFSSFAKQFSIIADLAEETDRAREEMRKLAAEDALTGAVRPYVFTSHLKQSLQRSKRAGTYVAVVFIDLDKFKPVNDLYGHDAGDETLKEIVRRARQVLRQEDVIARYGGDEFLILMEGIANADQARSCIEKLYSKIAYPFIYQGKTIDIQMSIGVAMSADPSLPPEELIKQADKMMYQAKRSESEHIAISAAPALRLVV